MKKIMIIIVTAVAFQLIVNAQFNLPQPFKWNHQLGKGELTVSVAIPEYHYLYDSKTNITVKDNSGNKLTASIVPKSQIHSDKFLGEANVLMGNTIHRWIFHLPRAGKYTVNIEYQGCKEAHGESMAACFMPSSEIIKLINDTVSKERVKGESERGKEKVTVKGKNEGKEENSNMPEFISNMIKRGGILIFLAAYMAGVLSTMTPCVLPMIPITVAVLGAGNKVAKSKAITKSALYVFGIVITFTAAATVAAVSGEALGANLLGNPYIVGTFTLIFIAFGVSMLGLFDLQLPQFIQNKLNTIGGGNSSMGAFLMGLAAGFVAFPCTGPILAVLLGLVSISGSIIFGVLLLATYALGFGTLIFIVGSGVGQLKPGVYMDRVKNFIGIAILILAGYGITFIFPEINNVLKHGGITAKSISLILIIAGFIMGAVHSDGHSPKKLVKTAKLAGAIFIASGVIWNVKISNGAGETLSWNEDISSVYLQSQEIKKPVLLDFFAEWCAACKEMEETTFVDKQVIEELKTNWILARINSTIGSEKVMNLQRKYKISGLPAIVIIAPDGTPKKTLTGYHNAKQLLTVLKEYRQSI